MSAAFRVFDVARRHSTPAPPKGAAGFLFSAWRFVGLAAAPGNGVRKSGVPVRRHLSHRGVRITGFGGVDCARWAN